jgi:hypothetical protein
MTTNDDKPGIIVYVARKPACGCICGALSYYQGQGDKWASKEIARWVAKGMLVERGTNEQVRQGWEGWHCPHVAPEPRQLDLFAGAHE